MWKLRSQALYDSVFFQYTSALKSLKNLYVWDLDKTYLDTQFQTIQGLVKTFFEPASQKKTIYGANTLLKFLARSEECLDGNIPLVFVTASPCQLEKSIVVKLQIDEIFPAAVICRDYQKYLYPKYWRYLKMPLGYKLLSLMNLRLALHPDVQQYMWGDDCEFDPIAYALYSDICSGRLSGIPLRNHLEMLHVLPIHIEHILSLQKLIPKNDPVKRVYIHLAEDTDWEYYRKFGTRFMPCYNCFEMAIDLYEIGQLSLEGILAVGRALREGGLSKEQLATSIENIVKRERLCKAKFDILVAKGLEQGLLPIEHDYVEEPLVEVVSEYSPGQVSKYLSNIR